MPRATPSPGDKARVAARRQKVLEYAKAGLSFRAIAERLTAGGEKISHVQVHKDFQAVMKTTLLATKASKEEMVALQTERLEMACVALVGKVAKGEIRATEVWIKLSQSYRKLHGLDKPIQIEQLNTPPKALDFSKLSLVEMRLLEELMMKAQAGEEEEGLDVDTEEEEDV